MAGEPDVLVSLFIRLQIPDEIEFAGAAILGTKQGKAEKTPM